MNSTYPAKAKENTCEVCGNSSIYISKILKVCADCIRNDFDGAKPYLEAAHETTRNGYNLPPKPPKGPDGIKCIICVEMNVEFPKARKGSVLSWGM